MRSLLRAGAGLCALWLAAWPALADVPVRGAEPAGYALSGPHYGSGASGPRMLSLGDLGVPARAQVPAYDETWLARQTLPENPDREFTCLATAIYFEARGESIRGQAAVAEVVLNRTETPGFPRTICRVVGARGQGQCAFSFVCDGRPDIPRERAAWERAKRVAAAMLAGTPRVLTSGATYFHVARLNPRWTRGFERTALIGNHLFLREPIRTASN